MANSIAAIRAGAAIVEVSVLGLGERAGNCPLEQLAVAVEGLYGTSTGLALHELTPLARCVAERAGIRIPPGKAVVGDDVFSQKLDIHVRVTGRAPWLHEPFDPATVGQERSLRLGSGSGPYAVRAKLTALGLSCDDARLPDLVQFVNRQALAQKDTISDEQLRAALETLVETP